MGKLSSIKSKRFDANKLKKGINWRAFLANAIVIAPLLVGLAYQISPTTVSIDGGLVNLYSISWLFGYPTSIFLYSLFSYISVPTETMVPKTIPGVPEIIDGENADIENVSGGTSPTPSVVKGGEKAAVVTENSV